MLVSKYASIQLYVSMQVWNYASMHIYASMQVCKYASMQICKYASIHVCKYASMKVWKYASMLELCTVQSKGQIDCMFALRHFFYTFWLAVS